MELQLTDSPGWEASANIVYAFVFGYIAVFWVSLLFIILCYLLPNYSTYNCLENENQPTKAVFH